MVTIWQLTLWMVSVDVAVVGVVSVVDVFIHLRCSDICEWAVRRSLWRVLCEISKTLC